MAEAWRHIFHYQNGQPGRIGFTPELVKPDRKKGGRSARVVPIIRQEILHSIWALSNKEYQQEGWLNQKNLPRGVEFDNFGEAVHWLFDDTSLADDTFGCIGWYLVDEEEANLVRKVLDSVDEVLDEVWARTPKGTKYIPDQEFLNSPKWENVVEAASNAWKVMKGKVYPPK